MTADERFYLAGGIELGWLVATGMWLSLIWFLQWMEQRRKKQGEPNG